MRNLLFWAGVRHGLRAGVYSVGSRGASLLPNSGPMCDGKPNGLPHGWAGDHICERQELARALLLSLLNECELAHLGAPQLARELVARLPHEGWTLTPESLRVWFMDRVSFRLATEQDPEEAPHGL